MDSKIPKTREYTSTLEAFNDGFKMGHYTCEKYHQDKEREVAIDFNEFLKDNHYTKSEKGWYQSRVIREDFPAGFTMSTHVYEYTTIEAIYELYIQSKK